MKTIVLGFLTSIICSTTFAGISADLMANALSSGKVKTALKDVEITSVKVIDNAPGGPGSYVTIVVCGLNLKGSNFATTRIDGLLAISPNGSEGSVVQTYQNTPEAICR
jgi:hypothetical protein